MLKRWIVCSSSSELAPVEAEAAGDEGPRHPGEAEPHLQLHHEAAAQPGLGLHVYSLHQQAEMRVLSNIRLPKLVPCCKLSWLANLISKFISTDGKVVQSAGRRTMYISGV